MVDAPDIHERRHHPRSPNDPDTRTVPQQDRDRILYSSAFRRLGGVTQVASVSEVHLIHNRLTHSLKVAQIGRRLAEKLVQGDRDLAAHLGVDADVVETAGLAHDLGHPPFGHVAEDELDQLARDVGLRFEGNAQTFRIVTKIAARKQPPRESAHLTGLDLCRGSLNAVLKYPALVDTQLPQVAFVDRSRASKGGVYLSEEAAFTFARGPDPDLGQRSAAAILMDWSDDVSYATHDIEDYVRAGLVPLHAIGVDRDAILDRVFVGLDRKRLSFSDQMFHDAFERLEREVSQLGRYQGTRLDDYQLNSFISGRITAYESQVELSQDPPFVHIPEAAEYEVEILKQITWHYVIETPMLAMAQEGQRSLVRELFERLQMWEAKRPTSLPAKLQNGLDLSRSEEAAACAMSDDAVVVRVLLDYLCGLTEAQAVDLFQRVTGLSPSPIFSTWA